MIIVLLKKHCCKYIRTLVAFFFSPITCACVAEQTNVVLVLTSEKPLAAQEIRQRVLFVDTEEHSLVIAFNCLRVVCNVLRHVCAVFLLLLFVILVIT